MTTIEQTLSHPGSTQKGLKREELTVTIARNVDEIERMRTVWEGLAPVPYADIDYFIGLISSRKSIHRPHVLLIEGPGKDRAIAAALLEEEPFNCYLGYKVIFGVSAKCLKVIDGGLMGTISPAVSNEILSSFMESLRGGEADLVSFEDIKSDSPIVAPSINLPGFFQKDHFPTKNLRFVMTLPGSMEEFYKGRKRKKNLRRITRRVEREFPHQVIVKKIMDKSGLDMFCREAEHISKKSYQYPYGSAFVKNPETISLVEQLAERECLRAYILYLDGNPSSFFGGFVYQGSLQLLYTGYDPEYHKLEVGTYLLLKLIEDSIEDPDIHRIDFMCGDYSYKRRFCDLIWSESSFYLFAPTFRGALLNLIRSINGILLIVGNVMLEKLNLKKWYEKLKRKRNKGLNMESA